MTVTQVGRDINGIRINVSGITKGDRQTYIWIPDYAEYFTLSDARDMGYVTGIYVADYSSNNGDITVWVSEEYYSECKTIGLRVKNGINIDTANEVIYSDIYIITILDFVYKNSFPKVPGTDIDITVSDMQGINWFGAYIYNWLHPNPEDDPDKDYFYPLDDVSAGDKIYYDYLRQPANLIYETAYNCDYLGSNYGTIYGYINDIVNNCVSGADFKAKWFNNIVYAIRNFNLSVTA